MERESTTRKIGRRTTTTIALLAVVGALVLGASFFYRQVGSLFRPSYGPGVETNTTDVTVERGTITKVINIYGMIEPIQQATLSFEHAMARVLAVNVFPGQQVAKGDALVELDAPALQRELARLRGLLQEAEIELDELLADSGDTRRLRLQDELSKAENDLFKAQQALAAFRRGEGTPAARREATAKELAKARIDLQTLRTSEDRQRQIDALRVTYNQAENKHGPYVLISNPSETDRDIELMLRHDMLDKGDALRTAELQWQMDIRAAEQAVIDAEAKLDMLDRQIAAGSARIEQAALQAAVRAAEVRVQAIRTDLESMDESPVDVEVAEAKAEVLKLQGQVADAETAMSEARLVAPFDGIINEVKIVPDSTVSPGTEALSMFSGASFRALAQVSDVDVTYLKTGSEVQITFGAFPADPVTGRLGEVPQVGRYINGQTVFEVPIDFEAPGLPLLSGMSADIRVPLYEKADVVMLPLMAVQYDAEGPFVIVIDGRRTEKRHIKLGINDGEKTEVTSGLDGGEVVRAVVYGPRGF